jgi:hypothetical protein
MKPEQCRSILLPLPLISVKEMNAMKHLRLAFDDYRHHDPEIRTLARIKVIILSDCAIGPDRISCPRCVQWSPSPLRIAKEVGEDFSIHRD